MHGTVPGAACDEHFTYARLFHVHIRMLVLQQSVGRRGQKSRYLARCQPQSVALVQADQRNLGLCICQLHTHT